MDLEPYKFYKVTKGNTDRSVLAGDVIFIDGKDGALVVPAAKGWLGKDEQTELTVEKAEQYCKLPIPITAYQTDKEFDTETLEGTHHASIGDWIITGVKGEQYPCKPDIFAKTYIKCGQANKMEMVSAMFGKRLGEEFTVKYQTPKHKYVTQYHVTFEEKGLTVYGQNKDIILRQLLTGQAMIVNE